MIMIAIIKFSFSQVGAVETVHINCGLPASRSLKGSTTLSMRTTSRTLDIASITARARCIGNCVNLNLPAIRIIGLIFLKGEVSFR